MKGRRDVPALPAPLSEKALCAAARELTQGPLAALNACLRCWREGRLGPAELVATARSFAASSPALRGLFSPQLTSAASAAAVVPMLPSAAPAATAEQSELATPEQMRELASLAAAATVAGSVVSVV